MRPDAVYDGATHVYAETDIAAFLGRTWVLRQELGPRAVSFCAGGRHAVIRGDTRFFLLLALLANTVTDVLSETPGTRT